MKRLAVFWLAFTLVAIGSGWTCATLIRPLLTFSFNH
jgi:hypothetical protein